MRIVVIGGTGHIGSYLVPRLVAGGHEVVSVTRGMAQPYQPHPAWAAVEQITLDRDAQESSGQFGRKVADLRPEVVVDTICFTEPSAVQLREALRDRHSHLVHVGTIWVHGTAVEVPTTEFAPRRPWGDYGVQKAAIERRYLGDTHPDVPVSIVHPGHISGPGWPIINPQGNVELGPWRALARGDELLLPNFGLETVHHVHADDVARLIELCISQPELSQGQAFHAVSDRALTLRGFAEIAAGWYGQEAHLRFAPFAEFRDQIGEEAASTTYEHIARSHSISNQKARSRLGYEPGYTSAAAAAEAVAWLAENGRLGDDISSPNSGRTS